MFDASLFCNKNGIFELQKQPILFDALVISPVSFVNYAKFIRLDFKARHDNPPKHMQF